MGEVISSKWYQNWVYTSVTVFPWDVSLPPTAQQILQFSITNTTIITIPSNMTEIKQYMYCRLYKTKSKIIWCFVAQSQEAPRVFCNCGYLDHDADIPDNYRLYEHRHHPGNVCIVGSIHQLCCRESQYFIAPSVHVPVANDDDGVMLR